MSESVGTSPLPALPYRARPPQVLLGVGAVLLVSAGAAVASAYGGGLARLLLLTLAATAAGLSLRAAWTGLRSSEEILAACAAGLGVAAGDLGRPELGGTPGIPVVLAVVFLVLGLAAPTTATWPVASWLAAQLAVLHGLHLIPTGLHTELYLCVALVGLGIALVGRRVVARLALMTTAPWWLAGVVGGSSSAWADDGGRQWFSAALMIAAGLGLLLARLRESLDPLLGPPTLVPVVAGVVAGAAVTGAFSSLGPLSMTLTGYAGVLIANLGAAYLEGWRRGLFLPVALAAGIVMTSLCLVQLLAGQRWAQLSLLLLLTAIPTALVAVHRSEDRPVALPTAVGCLVGAVLLTLPDGRLGPGTAAVLLTVLYGAALALGSGLDVPSRKATSAAAAVCAAAAVLLLTADGRSRALALVLAVQGLCTLGWAWRTGRSPVTANDDDARASWRAGAAQLVLAAWVGAATAGLATVEWYSLPTAAGLLIGAGPQLRKGASWPAWGPGLLVAAVPSAVLAVTVSDGTRAVGVLLVAAGVLVAGARTGIRAPLMIGAGTALALALGVTVRALPWPLGTALVIGGVLLAVGMRRELRPDAYFGARLADLR
ncbi:MAG: hypothetical protein JWQ37_843 [Blastococcus sp.]|nr:hypothetical protein [Blastococcus sp.]